jgi:probable HAF family extracellular repeat protein
MVLWNGSAVVSLPLPIAGGSASPKTLNQFGQIAGTATDANGVGHAFLWTPALPNGTSGTYLLLDAPGSAGGFGIGLNDFGEVVVTTRDGGTRLWVPASPNAQTGSWTTLTGPTGPLTGIDVNSRGDVLASAYVESNDYCWVYHLYLWRPSMPNGLTGSTIDLTPDVGADAYSCSATGTFLSEEENATVQVFGYVLEESTVSYYEYSYDQVWTVPNLDQPQPSSQPQPLTASIAAIFGGSEEGYPITFEARATPNSSTLGYQWDFGDGSSEDGGYSRSITHTYADNGQYTVRLTVSDELGHSTTATRSIIVFNLAPMGTLIAPAQTNEGGSYVLSVSDVFDASADYPSLQLALDCGDGHGYQSVAITGSLTCAAPNDALRTVGAQLRDKDGGVREYTAQVRILDVAPTVTVLSAPPAISDKSTYTISFKFTDPGLLDSWAYSIAWGDGTSSAPASVATQGGTISASHQYQIDRRAGNKSQSFVVTIRVNDNGGAAGTATSTVIVSAR